MELQSHVKELEAQGLGLATISYDAPDPIANFSRQQGITFPMLSDKGSETIKRYGILNPVPEIALGPNRDDPAIKAEANKYVSVGSPNERYVGIAFPGTFVLDRQGRVTSRFFEDFYIERNTVSSLMLKLGVGTAPVNATTISTPHLQVTTHPSDAAVAPGNRFTITLDIIPRPGMHVYAPGATGYRVITFGIVDQPFVRTFSIDYPASEIYFFAPLKERVPVFQKPFKLMREVVLEGQPQAQAARRGTDTVTLTGALQYQACDDKICFNPVSVPLSWTMSLRPLATQRPTRP